MAQFAKALDETSPYFHLMRDMFPRVSYKKVRAGIFDATAHSSAFKGWAIHRLNGQETGAALDFFKATIQGSLGDVKTKNYKVIVRDKLGASEKLGCHITA